MDGVIRGFHILLTVENDASAHYLFQAVLTAPVFAEKEAVRHEIAGKDNFVRVLPMEIIPQKLRQLAAYQRVAHHLLQTPAFPENQARIMGRVVREDVPFLRPVFLFAVFQKVQKTLPRNLERLLPAGKAGTARGANPAKIHAHHAVAVERANNAEIRPVVQHNALSIVQRRQLVALDIEMGGSVIKSLIRRDDDRRRRY